MDRIHTYDTPITDDNGTIDTLPTVQQTVDRLTEQNTDVNAVEVYQAYEVFIAEQEEREEEATATDIAVEEWTKMDDSRRQEESDIPMHLFPVEKEPIRAVASDFPDCDPEGDQGDLYATIWSDGSITAEESNPFEG